ncbi:MAG: rRNA maturation RNase YbeY [Planctomycetota bacterium]|nr:rRNA maturation RNase YbeY [Planctomycetota bacterium]MDP6761740.1 rRNA maturation RNase YbeY [Planctomycetota bacterium]MDP6990949.1 rRNA maturation RNase YbeY [Planctomycetota bacterium]
MSVGLHWQAQAPELPPDAGRAAVEAALRHGGRWPASVDVVFVDDRTIGELHGRFLGDPSPTDVIAFDLGDDGGVEAEIYVSVECARRVAAERGLPVARELALYAVHGALHLCGFDDVDDVQRAAMRAAEASVLAGLGYECDDAESHGSGSAREKS